MAPTQAEIKLVELKNCFVNVPRSIVALLDNAKAVSSLVALVGYIAHILPGCPKCCRRATVQGVFLDCVSSKEVKRRFSPLCVCWMDRHGEHSKVDVNHRQKWKKN